MQRLDALAEISESPDMLTRRYLTRQHAAANALVRGWMRQAGMTTRMDDAGNIIGRYEAARPGASALVLGSHLDTVINAGRYDGMLGVVLAIQCVDALHRARRRMPFAIEVVGFGDEEGLRFQSTYLGSRAMAGTFEPDLLERRDSDGISLRDAMIEFGLHPQAISHAARDPADILAYVEVHIEQGPVLERKDLPVGIVTAIAGATRLEVEVTGLAGHAGTVPMGGRRDALAAAAAMLLAVERLCGEMAEVVGTVGRIEADPGAVNVIAGAARFSVDLRSPSDQRRAETLQALRAAFAKIANERSVKVSVETTHDAASVPCAAWLMAGLGAAVADQGVEVIELASGAGHDAAAISAIADVAMLFVRCAGGISHNPRESVAAADVAVAGRVLGRFIETFDREAPAQP